MTMREVDRLRTIQSLVDGRLMTWQAAGRLYLSWRQVERLLLCYRSQGLSGLLSRIGQPSNYQLADGTAGRPLNLIRCHCADLARRWRARSCGNVTGWRRRKRCGT